MATPRADVTGPVLGGAAADALLPPPPLSRVLLPGGGRGPTLQADGPGPECGLACLGARPWAVSALRARRVRHFWGPPAG